MTSIQNQRENNQMRLFSFYFLFLVTFINCTFHSLDYLIYAHVYVQLKSEVFNPTAIEVIYKCKLNIFQLHLQQFSGILEVMSICNAIFIFYFFVVVVGKRAMSSLFNIAVFKTYLCSRIRNCVKKQLSL